MISLCSLDGGWFADESSCEPEVSGHADVSEAREGARSVDAFALLSANRFSKVPRSVLPSSSSESRPDRRKSDSMRPRRFSSPSIYLALGESAHRSHSHPKPRRSPFWRIALLLYLCEDAFRLVVLAVCAGGHLAVALYLLLTTHIARLPPFSQHLCLSPLCSANPTRAILLLFGSLSFPSSGPYPLRSSVNSEPAGNCGGIGEPFVE